MKLHYSAKPFALDARRYEQSKDMKPCGLWLSVEDAWAEWCRSSEFRLAALTCVQEVKLDGTLNLKHLRTADEVLAFSDEFCPGEEFRTYLDWTRIAERWDGLLISPYQGSVRLDHRAFWYYGWDCASGCVWNLKQTTLEPGERAKPAREGQMKRKAKQTREIVHSVEVMGKGRAPVTRPRKPRPLRCLWCRWVQLSRVRLPRCSQCGRIAWER
jgi:hypothetical protein